MNQTIYPSGHVVQENPPAVVVSPSGRMITRYQFLNRFTMTELAAILAAAKTDTIVEAIMKKLEAVKDYEVDLDDPQTIGGVDTLIAKGHIQANRKTAILS